ncbi:hypothetical protein PMI35_06651, partial [Pseudomonas sp. GM78]
MAIPADRHFCLHPVGAAAGCDLLILPFKTRSKDR